MTVKNTCLLLLPVAQLLLQQVQAADERPNIVIVLADDMGYADIGAHGCRDIPTPSIDRIAKEGVRCTDAYANGSFCTPTRAALLSCRYQQRSGNDDLDGVTGPLPLTIRTLADRMQSAGYLTGMVGKWHLGGAPGYTPLDRGFDEFFGFLGGGHYYLPNPRGKGSYYAPIFRQRESVDEQRYLTDAFGEEAAAFLKRHRNTEQPLLLYLAFNAVHTPMQATQEDLARFAEIKDGKRRTYAGMLTAMDRAIGRVLDELDESGKADNTLVIFHNDNGGPTTRNAVNGSRNTPLRGSKCETFEGGIRVPLMLRWPGKIAADSVYRRPVMTFDISATCLARAGAETKGVDGVDLMPYVTGKEQALPHEVLFWRSRPRNNNYAVRQGDWKYVHSTEGTEHPGPNHTPSREMLFNLSEDISEQRDLSAKHPQKLQELQRLYAEWCDEVDADCRKLGIEPPQPRQKKPTTPPSAVGKIEPTKAFPGLAKLHGVAVRKTELRLAIASAGNGLALRQLAEPIRQKTRLRLIMQPAAAFPSNGFLAFGKEATDAATVKCGLLVGGDKIAVFHGSYGAAKIVEANAELTGGKRYEVDVVIDLAAREIVLTAAGSKVTHQLPEAIDEIRYLGYQVIRSHTQFGQIVSSQP